MQNQSETGPDIRAFVTLEDCQTAQHTLTAPSQTTQRQPARHLDALMAPNGRIHIRHHTLEVKADPTIYASFPTPPCIRRSPPEYTADDEAPLGRPYQGASSPVMQDSNAALSL